MSAVLSPCGQYRYLLSRGADHRSAQGKALLFIGVNPSWADATIDDATIRKMVGFARYNHYLRIVVCNLFAYRDNDVRNLAYVSDPVGPENDTYLREEIGKAALVIPCWGSRAKLPDRLHYRIDQVKAMLSYAPVRTLGFTKSGDPKHPLMLGYSTPFGIWQHP